MKLAWLTAEFCLINQDFESKCVRVNDNSGSTQYPGCVLDLHGGLFSAALIIVLLLSACLLTLPDGA